MPKSSFFLKSPTEQQELYVSLITYMGRLSNLFSDSDQPYLYYRSMERIFCKAFEASDYSRSDQSADAGKNGIGIGLKTFLHQKGNTFQKVAEFNRDSSLFRNKENLDLIAEVAKMRNERIETTKRAYKLSDMMYHVVTRGKGKMFIFEEHMDTINESRLEILENKPNTILFTDHINDYSFSLSKSTLLKRFMTPPEKSVQSFAVDILVDPYKLIYEAFNGTPKTWQQDVEDESKLLLLKVDNDITDEIILPLYQTTTKNYGEVPEKSGLNQWRAAGRPRVLDEVYIPIPRWIHDVNPNFFDYSTNDHKTEPFLVSLPNGEELRMRVAQEGGKALMSNPNRTIGHWILREVLNIEPGVQVTRAHLDRAGIDAVKLSKDRSGRYYLDFVTTGTYEAYEAKMKS